MKPKIKRDFNIKNIRFHHVKKDSFGFNKGNWIELPVNWRIQIVRGDTGIIGSNVVFRFLSCGAFGDAHNKSFTAKTKVTCPSGQLNVLTFELNSPLFSQGTMETVLVSDAYA